MQLSRRHFSKLAGIGGAVFASGLGGCAATAAADDFYFVQITDTHWGYEGPANPESKVTLRKAVAAVNALPYRPDFIVFTGDLTHTTDDPAERRRRLAEFKQIVGGLTVSNIRFMPGEHDAALDRGAAYKEFFPETRFSFMHKGVRFIALDNTTDPAGALGEEQIAWLAAELAGLDRDRPLVVFAHRPLFELYPQWDWATRDGAAAMALLMPFRHVTVFYGHIHQEYQQMTGHIAHRSAASLIFPLPPAGSQPRRAPVAWDPAHPNRGLGFAAVRADAATAAIAQRSHPLDRV